MAKGSVRKKGKKWYYRFYVEDESGKMVSVSLQAQKANLRRKHCSRCR